VDASIAAWSTLRASLDAIGTELEETRRTLRETKEQLSVAHAENDQLQHRVRALELEVAESRGLLGDARSRLQDAFEALGGNAPRIDTEADTF
jgi:chromosome segregation ATPase